MERELKKKILNAVMKNGGEVIVMDNNSYINKIKGVYFNEQFKHDDEDEGSERWNAYVERIREAVNAKSWSYCTWVYDKTFNVIGVLAFYTRTEESIKMKHFQEWEELLKQIKDGRKINLV